MINIRQPIVGDLIIHNRRGKQFIGVVYALKYLYKWQSCFIYWPKKQKPQVYSDNVGYASINIANLRSEFVIIRNGTKIY